MNFYANKKSRPLSTEQIISLDHCFKYSLFLLNRRRYSTVEIQDKCSNRGYEFKVIQNTIKKLLDYKFLNDLDLAYSILEQELHYGSHGLKYVQNKLKHRKIPNTIINKVLILYKQNNTKTLTESNIELEACKKAFFKLVKKTGFQKDDFKNQQRMFRNLANRGFAYETIKKVLEVNS